MLIKLMNCVNVLLVITITFIMKTPFFIRLACYLDLIQRSRCFNDVETITVKEKNFKINFQNIKKDEAIDKIKKDDLNEKLIIARYRKIIFLLLNIRMKKRLMMNETTTMHNISIILGMIR